VICLLTSPSDLLAFNFNNFTSFLQTRPTEILPFFELGAKDALRVFLTQSGANQLDESTVPDFQVILTSAEKTQSLRTLTAEHVNRLLKVPGIVISCSRLRVKANLIVIRCKGCGAVKVRNNPSPRV
jgi:DNA replication licensing factor MCM5